MLASILAIGLLLGTPQDPQSRGDRAFEAARERQFAGETAELVLMMSNQGTGAWQTITVYSVLERTSSADFGAWRWIIRRDRWGDDWDYGASEDPGDRVLTTWADSASCPGVVTLLEGVEHIPPVPYDLRGLGSDYDGDILVGMARSRFWLNAGPMTPSIETRGHTESMSWWGNTQNRDAIAACWTTQAPSVTGAP